MHRRRSRDRRDQKPREDASKPQPQAQPATKRRGRADAPVPEELKLSRAPRTPARPRLPDTAAAARAKPPESSHPARGHRQGEPGSHVVLVTGFECFGGETVNPSWEICKRLPREIGGARVETCLVPCEFRRAIEVAAEAIQKNKPSVVISLGQAGGRSRIGVERVAINVDDARIPDNAGQQPVDETIAQNGPPAYFATVAVKAMTRAIRAAGIPAELSNSAGTYVCNHVMYGVLHFIAASGTKARAGFIHVPFVEAQVIDKRDAPAMSLDSMVRGIAAAIEAAVTTRTDIAAAEGALD
jgi:pyroglutamyl-peptidase